MTTLLERLRRLEKEREPIAVAVNGAGFVGRGLVYQLAQVPGIRPALVVSRTPTRAMEAYRAITDIEPLVSDEPDRLTEAMEEGRPAISTALQALTLSPVEVVVEATGALDHGAEALLTAIEAGKHAITMNYEVDATIGSCLRRRADERGVVYSGADGDQPAVMMGMIEYVRGLGLEVVAAVNCKGFLDRHATPDSIRPWAEAQGTSLGMTTAFTDGTKMQIENASVANASGLIPETHGMHGLETTLDSALDDFRSVLSTTGVVDYTLGGDFKGGIFVIAAGAHPDHQAPYLDYLKMGKGPWYLFYRPWHLVHFETPFSIAEAVLNRTATIAPLDDPITRVVAVAKRRLRPGQRLDGIGGFDCYGEIDSDSDEELLPVGVAHHATVKQVIEPDSPIHLHQIELDLSERSMLLACTIDELL